MKSKRFGVDGRETQQLITNDSIGFDEFPYEFWYQRPLRRTNKLSALLMIEPDWTAVTQGDEVKILCSVIS